MSDNGEEVIISSSGRAIVSGQEINIEDAEDHNHSSMLCPAWLRDTPPILKCGLSTAGLLFVAFVSMMVVGLAGQGSSSSEDFIDAQYEQAVSVDTYSGIATSQPTARPTPTYVGLAAIPIESEQIIIYFPGAMEQRLSMIADGSSSNVKSDWQSIQQAVESTIAVSLFQGLPADYTLGAIEVEQIDGNDASSVGVGTTFTDTNHTIIYSSSVVVDCAISDCSAAPDTVQSAVYEIQQMDVVPADVEWEVDEVDNVDLVATDATGTTAPSQDAIDEIDAIEPTDKPTEAPISNPTQSPTYLPTAIPTVMPVVSGPQSLTDGKCSQSTPCDACFGSCSSDEDCSKDLLCFRRLYWDNIPGCEGPGVSGQSYCYDPFSEGLTKDVLLNTKNLKCGENGYKCNKCEGKRLKISRISNRIELST